MTSICIFGAGAIGGYVGARLAMKGEAEVSLVARGPHLAAMKSHGLVLKQAGETHIVHPKVTGDPSELGPQDYIILTLKAHAVAGVIDQMQPLIGPHTAILFAQNGIPWWYDIGLVADVPPPDLGFLDPGGQLRSMVSPERIIGGVVFSSNEVVAPGVVANLSPDRNMLLIGECNDHGSARIEQLRADLTEAAIQSPPVTSIRETIWTKLLTNMSMSVLCLLTGQTARGVRDEPDLQDIIPRLLDEANAVAQSSFPGVKRLARSGPAPDHKPSILQDYELGRAMEIDVLVRAPAAFARAAGLSTPMLDFMAALAIRQARDKGPYTG